MYVLCNRSVKIDRDIKSVDPFSIFFKFKATSFSWNVSLIAYFSYFWNDSKIGSLFTGYCDLALLKSSLINPKQLLTRVMNEFS